MQYTLKSGKRKTYRIAHLGAFTSDEQKILAPMAQHQGIGRSVTAVPIHRALMAIKIWRPLLPTEVVHHINDDETDNSIENLQLMSREEHQLYHKAMFFNQDQLMKFNALRTKLDLWLL